MRIIQIPIEKLKPSERNPRVIPPEAVEAVRQSIDQFGFLCPIVVSDEFEILAGHTRHRAAAALGLAKVPCVRASHLTTKQQEAFRLADNKVSELTSWDDSALYGILASLGEEELPPGFTEDDLSELADIFKEAEEPLPSVGDSPANPGGQAGNKSGLVPLVFRVRKDVYDEAKKQCGDVIAELEK